MILDPLDVLNISLLFQATMLFVVPPMVHFLGLKPEVTNDHLKYLRLIMSAAAPLGEDDILRCIKKAPCGVNFIQGIYIFKY